MLLRGKAGVEERGKVCNVNETRARPLVAVLVPCKTQRKKKERIAILGVSSGKAQITQR